MRRKGGGLPEGEDPHHPAPGQAVQKTAETCRAAGMRTTEACPRDLRRSNIETTRIYLIAAGIGRVRAGKAAADTLNETLWDRTHILSVGIFSPAAVKNE